MGAGRTTERSEVQGDRFERTFSELITRLVETDLGLTLLDHPAQSRGSQFGKDLQFRWLTAGGDERVWQFECKSHGNAPLAAKEVGDKLLQFARSSHRVDVWCLALANVEPSNELNELLAAAPDDLGLESAVTTLSPKRGRIKRLYACHPELWRRQYRTEPIVSLTRRERALVIDAFGEWLEVEYSKRRPAAPLPAGWELVQPDRFDVAPQTDSQARRYLRGLTETCPWEAIAYEWAVVRRSALEPLADLVRQANPGILLQWVVAAGGEGKSTVLKQLAWDTARRIPESLVVFGRSDLTSLAFPTAWLGAVPADSATVLVCVDGSRNLAGLPAALSAEQSFTERDLRVVVVVAERGSVWRRNRWRIAPRRGSSPALFLSPLTTAERDSLVALLDDRDLLHTTTRHEAAASLARAARGTAEDRSKRRAERPWLLPTVMELTDPEGRPFDQILRSVLLEFVGDGEADAVRLLLSISLLHGSGSPMPREIAQRIVPATGGLDRALEVIDTELDQQFNVPLPKRLRVTDERLVTHGWVVSDGFVRVSLSDPQLRRFVLTVCGDLPRVMAPEYSSEHLLRTDRFDLLDMAADYLDYEVRDHQAAAALLSGWVDLDRVGFPALHRLGEALLHSLQDELRAGASAERARALADAARVAMRGALSLAREVFAMHPVPTPYAGMDLQQAERVCLHGWATLEATVGTPRRGIQLGGRPELLRGVYLAVLSLRARGRKDMTLGLGLLVQILDNLNEYELAAMALGVLASVAGGDNYVVKRMTRRLKKQAVVIPAGGTQLLSRVLAGSVALVSREWSTIGIASSEKDHRQKLAAALVMLQRDLPHSPELRAVIDDLQADSMA